MATHTLHYSLPAYIPLKEAAKLTGLPVSTLREHIAAGTIRAITVNGEMAVSKQSAIQLARQALPREQLPEYEQFDHLKKSSIGINEAAKKYNVAFSTLRQWSQHGYIKRVGKDKNKVLLDEQDVAYCVFIYKRNRGQGKRVFNRDGSPFTPKHLQLA